MKKKVLLGILSFCVASVFAQNEKAEYTQITNNIIRLLQLEAYDSMQVYFDSTLRANLKPELLEQTMISLQQGYGTMGEAKSPVVEDVGPRWMSRTPINFERSQMVLSLSFDSAFKISGMFISPASGVYVMPNYVQSLSFLESKHQFGKEGWKLNGTLSYPKDNQKHPVAIIVHGSGPLDKDGSTGNTKIYKDLAWGLASQGICVFRYEKRTATHGTRFSMETYNGYTYTVQDEVIDDVLYAIELLKQNSHVDSTQIYIIGHSQGGMLAPLIAKQSKVKLAGAVLLAANARPIQELLVEQMNYLYPSTIGISYNDYMMVEGIKRKAFNASSKNLTIKTPADSLPFNVAAQYWMFLNKYNQTEVFKTIAAPFYVLQGERDYQVTMKDFDLWKKAATFRKAPTAFKSYPALNHLFIVGEGKSKPSEYDRQGNMDVQVVNDISNWIKSTK